MTKRSRPQEPGKSTSRKRPINRVNHNLPQMPLNRKAVKLALLALLDEFSREARDAIATLLHLETQEEQAENQAPDKPNGSPRKLTPKPGSR